MSSPAADIDSETLRAIYAQLGAEQIDYNVRKWDVLRVASVLAPGLLAAAGGLLSAERVSTTADAVAGVALMLVAAVLWFWVRTGVPTGSAGRAARCE